MKGLEHTDGRGFLDGMFTFAVPKLDRVEHCWKFVGSAGLQFLHDVQRKAAKRNVERWTFWCVVVRRAEFRPDWCEAGTSDGQGLEHLSFDDRHGELGWKGRCEVATGNAGWWRSGVASGRGRFSEGV